MKNKIIRIRETFRNSQSRSSNKDYGDDKFQKFRQLIKQKSLTKTEFDSAISSMNERINQKKIPYRLKRDYQSMKFLVSYNQRLHQKFNRKMKKMKALRSQAQNSISFGAVQKQIKKTNKQLKISQFLNLDIEKIIQNNDTHCTFDQIEEVKKKQKNLCNKFTGKNMINFYENSMHKYEGLKTLSQYISPKNLTQQGCFELNQNKNEKKCQAKFSALSNFNQLKLNKIKKQCSKQKRESDQRKTKNSREIKTSHNHNDVGDMLKHQNFSQLSSSVQRTKNMAVSFKKQQFYNNQVKLKIQLLSQIIEQNELTAVTQAIEKQINKFNLQCQPEKFAEKMRRYIVNHIILQKFLTLICYDVNRIQSKNRDNFKKLYLKIKGQMVSIKSDQENFIQKLKSIRKYQETCKQTQFNKSENMKLNAKNRKNPAKKVFFSHYSTKENHLIQQIQRIFQKANYFLKDAYAKCGKQDSKNELDEILKRRAAPNFTDSQIEQVI